MNITTLPETLRKRIVFNKTNGRCFYCGTVIPEMWEIEHKIPLSRGGSDDIDNLVPACVECNRRKGDRTSVEFMLGRILDL